MRLDFFKSSPCSGASLIVALPFLLSIILSVVFAFLVSLAAGLKLVGSDTLYVIFMVGSMGFMFWFVIVLVVSLVGVILAAVGLFRREKRPLIAVLGLMLNGCPLILMVLVLFRNRLF
jgi:hypothetical protein